MKKVEGMEMKGQSKENDGYPLFFSCAPDFFALLFAVNKEELWKR